MGTRGQTSFLSGGVPASLVGDHGWRRDQTPFFFSLSRPGKWPKPRPNQCTEFSECCYDQYFGQNSGSYFGHAAIVTQLCVSGAGVFQAVPLGSESTPSIAQLWSEGTALETRHGKR